MQIPDILKCNEDCPSGKGQNTVKLSLDGVSESRSTNVSLDVYSLKLNECQTVYPLRIIRPLCKLSVNYMDNFKAVLTEIDLNDCQLSHVIADNPKRAFVRNSLSHGSKYACEYCFAQGLPLSKTPEILQKLDMLEKKKQNIISRQHQDLSLIHI